MLELNANLVHLTIYAKTNYYSINNALLAALAYRRVLPAKGCRSLDRSNGALLVPADIFALVLLFEPVL